ncbi:MAG: FGGY family carbohydrate kinase [Thermoproteota archaeon]
MEECVLVIELTTRAVYSRLISESGNIVSSFTRPLDTILPFPDRPYIVELDHQKIWFSICCTAAECVKQVGPRKILAITTTVQRFSTAIIGRDGRTLALCPNIDARGAEVEELSVDPVEAYRITGLYPPFLFSGSRIRWFIQNKPEVFSAARFFTTLNGWVNFMLTGRPAEEPSQAAGTYLFDITRLRWSDELSKIVNIEIGQLPEILNFGQLVGYPTESFQRATGISSETPVVMGAGDTQCSGIGSMAISSGQAYVSLGSTAPLHVIMSEPRVDEQRRMWTGCFPLDGLWVLESNAGVCGNVFDWLAYRILRVRKRGGIDYPRFDKLAESAPRGSRGILVFLGPSIMDAKMLAEVSPAAIFLPPLMIGEKPGANDIARACYENIAFACRANLEQMREVASSIRTPIIVSGGLSNSNTLIQILADVLAMPVATPLERRASAVGASVACWSFLRSDNPQRIVKKMVELKTTNPAAGFEDYQSDYRRWRLIYDRLRSLM